MAVFLKKSTGSAILYSVLLVSIAISVVLVLSTIFIGKLKILKESEESLEAIFAADSGLESCLYTVRKLGGSIASCSGAFPGNGVLSNGAKFQIIDLGNQTIRSIGSVNGINRSLEVNEAL